MKVKKGPIDSGEIVWLDQPMLPYQDQRNHSYPAPIDQSQPGAETHKEQKDYESWDSFAQLNLITFVESKFDITLSLEESIDIKSAHDLLECVRSHLK